MNKIILLFVLAISVLSPAQIDYRKAPNSYLFDIDVAKSQNRVGLKIPVAKAYDMWENGKYMGDSNNTIPDGEVSAVVYWEDVHGLITTGENFALALEGAGRDAKIVVPIDVTKGKGNAVVAYKVNEEVYWSWHIWVTDNPENGSKHRKKVWGGELAERRKIDINTNYYNADTTELIPESEWQWMDRNLGATSASIVGDEWNKTSGLQYQWGRKDPIPPLVDHDGYFYEVQGDVGTLRHKNAKLTKDLAGNNIAQKMLIGVGFVDRPHVLIKDNIRYATKNPTKIVMTPALLNTGHWFVDDQHYYEVNGSQPYGVKNWDLWADNRRGHASHANSSSIKYDSRTYELKSSYDPCPNGWRVPSGLGSYAVSDAYGYNPFAGVNQNIVSYNSNSPSFFPNLKIYPGIGYDFSDVSNMNIGVMPMNGNYEYYPNPSSPNEPKYLVYEDHLSDGGIMTATMWSWKNDGYVNFKMVDDYQVDKFLFSFKEGSHTTETSGVRCLRDPYINQNIPNYNFPTEYIIGTEQVDYTTLEEWTKQPNSYVVMTDETTNLEIPLGKAYAMHKLYLSENKTYPQGNQKNVKVHWTTNQNLIQSVTLIGEYPTNQKIKVELNPSQYGNAVISFHIGNNGLFNANSSQDDAVIWSYHIWAPKTNPLSEENQLTYITETRENGGVIGDNPQLVNLTKSGAPPLKTIFMKMDLGALQVFPTVPKNNFQDYEEQLSESGGLHFQWGRKDPLPTFHQPGEIYNTNVVPSYSVYTQSGFNGNEIQYTEITETDFEDSYAKEYAVYSASANVQSTDPKHEKLRKVLAYSVQHPLSFLYHSSTGDEVGYRDGGINIGAADYVKDWISNEAGLAPNRWGHATEKSPYDPCPEGWRVPDTSTTGMFAYSNSSYYGLGISPWFYNFHQGTDTYNLYGVRPDLYIGLTDEASNNPINEEQYPGYQVSDNTRRYGLVFDFEGSKYKIGNIPFTGMRGIVGGKGWTYDPTYHYNYPKPNYLHRTGLWTSAPADYYTGYAIGLEANNTSDLGARLSPNSAFYPQAGMSCRCAKEGPRILDQEIVSGVSIGNPGDTGTLSTNDQTKHNKEEKWILSPNPTNGDLNLIGNKIINDNYQIYNMEGQLIKEGAFMDNKTSIKDLPKGIYLLKLKFTDKSFKVIKL